ncbi:hypothetical protein BC938DRAFT_475216 [Jimgerdemannia flammicorona]|uniref:RRM domain-containing protein n=1 Tax=Jimgerdemannia flammicorona TaxID=994334 RepID=A0A433QRV3_9FUNG|nr:hypothetical protein BC938DRAFT_475216 [Jimgerdemannia flammicorona]
MAFLSQNGNLATGDRNDIPFLTPAPIQSHDRKCSVFVGNFAFDAQEEGLWAFFKNCGEIGNVRIVRDSKTNLGLCAVCGM